MLQWLSELLPPFCIAKVSLSLFKPSNRSIISCSLFFTLVSNGHSASIIWSPPVCLSVIQISALLHSSLWSVCREKSYCILQCHFLALSLECVYTTPLHLKTHIFFTLPNKQLHQPYHVVIGGTAFVQAYYILQPHAWLFSFFLCAIYIGMRHFVCLLFYSCCLFLVLFLVQPLAFPLLLFSTVLSLVSSKFSGFSLYLFSP